jgi:hypothetical protein
LTRATQVCYVLDIFEAFSYEIKAENNAEVAISPAPGFSKWQLFKTLPAEVMMTAFFALLLGVLVGHKENMSKILTPETTIVMIPCINSQKKE